ASAGGRDKDQPPTGLNILSPPASITKKRRRLCTGGGVVFYLRDIDMPRRAHTYIDDLPYQLAIWDLAPIPIFGTPIAALDEHAQRVEADQRFQAALDQAITAGGERIEAVEATVQLKRRTKLAR